MVKKVIFHEAYYGDERVKVSSMPFQYNDVIKEAIRSGRDTIQLICFGRFFLQNFFMKADTWKHEKEYQVIYSIEIDISKNVPIY